MRVIKLSDHPGTLLAAVHDQRQAAEEREWLRYQKALADHHAHVAEASRRRDEARALRQWWSWFRDTLSLWAEKRTRPRPPTSMRGTSDQEQIIAAGMSGEQIVAAELGHALGNDWLLLQGYRNRRGEIDHVLIGAGGVFAMEVKHRNATVYIDGDNWQFDKYDRYGNLVEQGEIRDKGGRSPSEQVNQAADELERFLRSRRLPVSIRRMVLLTHPRSELGDCQNLTVDVTTSMSFVIDIVSGSPHALHATQVAELERLVIRDHHYHEGRRPAL